MYKNVSLTSLNAPVLPALLQHLSELKVSDFFYKPIVDVKDTHAVDAGGVYRQVANTAVHELYAHKVDGVPTFELDTSRGLRPSTSLHIQAQESFWTAVGRFLRFLVVNGGAWPIKLDRSIVKHVIGEEILRSDLPEEYGAYEDRGLPAMIERLMDAEINAITYVAHMETDNPQRTVVIERVFRTFAVTVGCADAIRCMRFGFLILGMDECKVGEVPLTMDYLLKTFYTTCTTSAQILETMHISHNLAAEPAVQMMAAAVAELFVQVDQLLDADRANFFRNLLQYTTGSTLFPPARQLIVDFSMDDFKKLPTAHTCFCKLVVYCGGMPVENTVNDAASDLKRKLLYVFEHGSIHMTEP